VAVAAPALAIDIGGTKLAAAVVDGRGTVTWRAAVPTLVGATAEEVFDGVVALWQNAPAAHAAVCGVGCGGPMDPGGERVSPLNIPAWRGFPLRARVRELTGLPTYVDNDAKAVALGEGWCGAAGGHRNYIGMVVSTGVGGGIVLEGRLLDGASGNAGHIGHLIVNPGGRKCACGARGCLEAEASGTAIAAITGRPAVEADDETIARTGRLVGQAVGSVANLLDLRLAVVGGSVALGFGAAFFRAAQSEVDASARLDFSVGARIVPAQLGADAPLVGAAAVGRRGLAADRHARRVRILPPRPAGRGRE
jgi:glucokinase